MERFAEKQARIEARRHELIDQYPGLLEEMVTKWQLSGVESRAWLLYSANYLFRTGNLCWAIDPYLLPSRFGTMEYKALPDFSKLSFVLLTHEHRDHLDLGFIKALRELRIRWVIPEAMQADVMRSSGLDAEKVITPRALVPLELEGMQILPFEGQHIVREKGKRHGVLAMGYQVEQNGQCWLFPGDTRKYNVSLPPDLDKADVAFVHLWLGRAEALEETPSQLDAFCRFCAGLPARRIILTHLEEVGREADDYWDMDHARRVMERLKLESPEKVVSAHLMGNEIKL